MPLHIYIMKMRKYNFIIIGFNQIEHHPPLIGETMGVSVKVMEELGYTTMKKDEQGNDLREIDWEKTKAVAIRANHIYLNLKGRGSHGIVDPADQYELEEEIMTALYNYHDPETNRRVIALAVQISSILHLKNAKIVRHNRRFVYKLPALIVYNLLL